MRRLGIAAALGLSALAFAAPTVPSAQAAMRPSMALQREAIDVASQYWADRGRYSDCDYFLLAQAVAAEEHHGLLARLYDHLRPPRRLRVDPETRLGSAVVALVSSDHSRDGPHLRARAQLEP
jgi:hypothetical protein